MCRKTARGPTQTVEVVPAHHPRSTAGGPTCGQFPFLESTCLLRTIMPAFVLGRATIGITITTDPVNDTDDVMGDHSPADGPDPTNWTFLATVPDWPADATRRLAYGHTFSKTGEGYQVHGVVSHVVDKQGRWCARPLHRRRHHDCQPGLARCALDCGRPAPATAALSRRRCGRPSRRSCLHGVQREIGRASCRERVCQSV